MFFHVQPPFLVRALGRRFPTVTKFMADEEN
jgi:hypothetical protein